jgi:hypothetical protein
LREGNEEKESQRVRVEVLREAPRAGLAVLE